ncbi:MAG: hypothetical protein HDT29_03390 [Clostridiales bacterium]|nr:hypothetical protein [Clostridiales bacterium]
MDKDAEKKCLNCAHFIRYYVKDRHGNLLKLDKGHCINSAIRKRSNRTFELCGQWQEREPETIERNRTLKYILKNIEHYLKNLEVAIKDDDDLDTYTD